LAAARREEEGDDAGEGWRDALLRRADWHPVGAVSTDLHMLVRRAVDHADAALRLQWLSAGGHKAGRSKVETTAEAVVLSGLLGPLPSEAQLRGLQELLEQQRVLEAMLEERAAGARGRVISDCHFRKTATEYDRKPGIKWLSCTEK
jgi:hypothetical protein